MAAPLGTLQTVTGPIHASQMGTTLCHEHVMVDFAGADKTGTHRWDRDEVAEVMLPHLLAARRAGVRTLFECTPAFLGRDPELLRRVAKASGLQIVTNTGLYKDPYLPRYAHSESVDKLAARWRAEFDHGIAGTGIRPGFIKIAVNPGMLVPVQQKIVRAAAITSLATGMAIACHTAHGPAALEAIEIVRQETGDPSRFIFVHADGEADQAYHLRVMDAGAWVEYDAVGWRPVQDHVELIMRLVQLGRTERLLVSHDGGWYHVGEPRGGKVMPLTVVTEQLVPALVAVGAPAGLRDKLLKANPATAFGLRRTA